MSVDQEEVEGRSLQISPSGLQENLLSGDRLSQIKGNVDQ